MKRSRGCSASPPERRRPSCTARACCCADTSAPERSDIMTDRTRDRFTDLLSDYLDHDLPRGEAEALERHLTDCAECRDTLAALERVKTRAATLVDPPAPTDLWAGIASRIGTAGSTSVEPRRFAVRELPSRRPARRPAAWAVPQWALAAAAFAV